MRRKFLSSVFFFSSNGKLLSAHLPTNCFAIEHDSTLVDQQPCPVMFGFLNTRIIKTTFCRVIRRVYLRRVWDKNRNNSLRKLRRPPDTFHRYEVYTFSGGFFVLFMRFWGRRFSSDAKYVTFGVVSHSHSQSIMPRDYYIKISISFHFSSCR